MSPVRRERIFKILAVSLSPIFLLLLLELAVRVIDPSILMIPYVTDEASSSVIHEFENAGRNSPGNFMVAAPPSSPEPFAQKKIRPLPQGLPDRDNVMPRRNEENREATWLMKNLNHHSYQRVGDEVIFDVQLRTDAFGRRLTPLNPRKKKDDRFLMVLGCSYVFGVGLEDEQTLPSQLAKHLPSTQVYNYGWPAGSTLSTWDTLRRKNLPKEIPETRGSAMFMLQPFHMERLLVNYRWWKVNPESMKNHPWVEANSDGSDLVDRGLQGDRTLRLKFFNFLQRIRVLQWIWIDAIPHFTDGDYRLMAASLKAIEKEIRKSKELDEFFVVLAPNLWLSRANFKILSEMRDHLNRAGIRTLDFSHWRVRELMSENPRIWGDGHPSKDYNQFFAPYLATALKAKP